MHGLKNNSNKKRKDQHYYKINHLLQVWLKVEHNQFIVYLNKIKEELNLKKKLKLY